MCTLYIYHRSTISFIYPSIRIMLWNPILSLSPGSGLNGCGTMEELNSGWTNKPNNSPYINSLPKCLHFISVEEGA